MAVSDDVGVAIIIYNIIIWAEKCTHMSEIVFSLCHLDSIIIIIIIWNLNCWISWIYCATTAHQDIPVPDTRPINGTLEWKIPIECRRIESNWGNILPSINFNGIFWSGLRSIRPYLEIMMSRIENLTVAQSHSLLPDADFSPFPLNIYERNQKTLIPALVWCSHIYHFEV